MIVIRFGEEQHKQQALGYLMGRFAFTSYKTGEMLVPEQALGALATEGIQFQVEGPATYEHSPG